MSHKLHNPRANAPAVYIPVWLSQVPSSKLMPSSKMVYGRLSQWATSDGKAHRSAAQLSDELGIPERTVERCLENLRENALIGSYLIADGGHNHFEFYDHPWMHEPIHKNLCYKSDSFTPSAKMADPSAKMADPSAKMAEHKIKEIKENNNNNNNRDFPHNEKQKQKQKQNTKTLACANKECIESFEGYWADVGCSIEEAYDACQKFWDNQSKIANYSVFNKFLKNPRSRECFIAANKPAQSNHSGFASNNPRYTIEEIEAKSKEKAERDYEEFKRRKDIKK